ncbi:hypothetical protein LTR85_009037 [Meristemomyces frigidus]|nr:hypothetical protein LTR85_009037 [Meristemomyces frigidus]
MGRANRHKTKKVLGPLATCPVLYEEGQRLLQTSQMYFDVLEPFCNAILEDLPAPTLIGLRNEHSYGPTLGQQKQLQRLYMAFCYSSVYPKCSRSAFDTLFSILKEFYPNLRELVLHFSAPHDLAEFAKIAPLAVEFLGKLRDIAVPEKYFVSY